MRILHVDAGNLYGGVETLLVTFARSRKLCPGMDHSFALSFEGRLCRELCEAGVPVYSLGEVRSSRYWTIHRARLALRIILNEHRFDVVVTHMSWSHAIFGPEVRRAGIPLVNWVHGLPPKRSWLDVWAGMTLPDLVIYNSRYTAGVAKNLFSGARSEVVYLPVNGPLVPPPDRCSVRRQLGVEGDAVVILQASRMEAWKGHGLLVDALARLKELSGWICWISGGAQRAEERVYLKQLEDRVVEGGICDRVKFLGQRSDVQSLMMAADIFCQPNQGPEPFGIVFIEALWNRLPVVTTNMGGATEIINETCGVMTPPGDPGALAESLSNLITFPKKRQALGQAGPLRARTLCDPLTQLNHLYGILENVV